MYRAWAGNRHMQLAEIAGGAPRDLPLLLISGFGAHRVLAREMWACTCWSWRRTRRARAGRRRGCGSRSRRSAICRPTRFRAALAEALGRGPQPHAVVRRYRSEPSPLVRNMNGSWRTGKLDAVLRGDFDLIAASQP